MRDSRTRRVLASANGRYDTYEAMTLAVVDAFNKHLEDMPPQYYYTYLIERGWKLGIVRRDGNSYVIDTTIA